MTRQGKVGVWAHQLHGLQWQPCPGHRLLRDRPQGRAAAEGWAHPLPTLHRPDPL